MNTSSYKFGSSQLDNISYYEYTHGREFPDDRLGRNGYTRHLESSSTTTYEQTATPQEGPWSHHNARIYEVVWQDNVDPDSMTYEELLELGEAVGTQSRGLSQELISLLPISKFKCGFFSRKKSRNERCVICQMEYKRRDRQITLPCKHAYHAGCCSRWLSMNKACPICYKEVFSESANA